MDRSEIMELRKLFTTYKESGCPVNGFGGGFINPDGEVKSCFANKNFHDIKDGNIKKRVFTLVSKTISNNATTLEINSHARDLFEKINHTKGSNDALITELCKRISDAIAAADCNNSYAVHVLQYTYDVPAKTSDHKTIIDGDGEEIFNFFVCAIAPVKTSKPSYGYFAENNIFAMNPMQWVVDNPVCGFVYPDFTGRTSNQDSVLYFRTEKLDISGQLFGSEAPALPDKESKSKTLKTEVVNDIKVDISDDKPEPTSSKNDAIPSLDSGSLSLEGTNGRDITSEREEKEVVAEAQEKKEGSGTTLTSIPKGKKVRITGNTKGIEKKMVDGVMCFVIPVSDADMN